MDFIYMNQLQMNSNLHNEDWSENRPMEESEIIQLEAKYNKGRKFPKAFREYLFLAGKGSAVGVIDHDFDYLLNNLQDMVEYTNDKLDRPFFIFNEHSGFFSIFFLDENKEDPDVYIYTPGGDKNRDSELVTLKTANNYTFSGLINEAIRRIKNDIPF